MRRRVIGPPRSATDSEPSRVSSRKPAYSTPFRGGRPPSWLATPDGRYPTWPPNCIRAAEAFNDVTYGERPGTESAYRMIAELDDHLRRHTAGATAGTSAPATAAGLGGSAMTQHDSAVGPTVMQRWRSARWVVLAIVVIVGGGGAEHLLTAPRPGGRMDAESTSPDGARALVTLLRDHGVDVIVADDIAAVERAARPDTLILVAQTFYLADDDVLRRLDALPATGCSWNRRHGLARNWRRRSDSTTSTTFGGAEPGLRPAGGDARRRRYSSAWPTPTKRTATSRLTRCYEGALVRYTDDGRTITVVGSADFMTNSGLLNEGNAALAMNLAGTHPRLIWYAPQRSEGETRGRGNSFPTSSRTASRGSSVQLCLVVALLALWKARRVGPLVAEQLPVVVRASETVEGRGRLYRSRRAVDRAADALRTATLQRMLPRLGLGHDSAPPAVVQAVAERCGLNPQAVAHTLFGPPPATDADLVILAHELDNIERQVAQS